MLLIFGTEETIKKNINHYVPSITEIMKYLVDHNCREIVDDIAFDSKFIEYFLEVLSKIYVNHNIMLIANTFIQLDTLDKLSEYANISVYTDEESKVTNSYDYILKHFSKSAVEIRKNKIDFGVYDTLSNEQLIYDLMYIWRLRNMGEITDAIAKALKDIESNEKVDDSEEHNDRIKQAMSDMGMPVDGYESTSETFSYPEDSELVIDMSDNEIPDEVYINEENSDKDEESDEICIKISGNTMAIMIPKGTKLSETEVNGIMFDTIAINVPDLSSSKLQISEVLNVEPKEKTEEIVRVPIISDKTEEDEENDESSYEELIEIKSELDTRIKEARKNGDDDLVLQLRKQRRKIRAQINNMVED